MRMNASERDRAIKNAAEPSVKKKWRVRSVRTPGILVYSAETTARHNSDREPITTGMLVTASHERHWAFLVRHESRSTVQRGRVRTKYTVFGQACTCGTFSGPRNTNTPESKPGYSAIDSPLSLPPEKHALGDTSPTLGAPCGVPAANSNAFIFNDGAICTACRYVVGFGHQNKFRFVEQKNNTTPAFYTKSRRPTQPGNALFLGKIVDARRCGAHWQRDSLLLGISIRS